jgi:flagellar FliL protein
MLKVLTVILWALSVQCLASGGGGGSEASAGSIYITFKPPLIANFGGPGRLKYLKADFSLRVDNSEVAGAVQHNMPLIRNNLLALMARQTDETMSGQPGKEALRQEALKEIQSIIKTEADMDGILDLFYNNLLVQK